MNAIKRVLTVLSMLIALTLISAAPAYAQATRTWISGVGDDVNPCSRTAPCKTFPGAISKTAAGGEINCLDPGGFGGVTITKSITLDCGGGNGGQNGSILVVGTNGITINAGASDKITIRNMSINGTNGQGLNGIRFIAGQSLTIQHTTIFGFGTSSGAGVSFEPNAAGAKLSMRDVDIQNIANSGVGNGISVAPQNGVAASAMIDHVIVTGSAVNGLYATDGASVIVSNSQFTGGGRGINARSTSVATQVNLEYVQVGGSLGQGILSNGATATVRLSNTGIYGNGVGLQSSSSGVIFSFGNNRIAGNGTDGSPTATGLQQ